MGTKASPNKILLTWPDIRFERSPSLPAVTRCSVAPRGGGALGFRGLGFRGFGLSGLGFGLGVRAKGFRVLGLGFGV